MPTIPANFSVDLASSTGAFFAQLSPTTVMIGGVLLATLVVGIIISFLHPK